MCSLEISHAMGKKKERRTEQQEVCKWGMGQGKVGKVTEVGGESRGEKTGRQITWSLVPCVSYRFLKSKILFSMLILTYY